MIRITTNKYYTPPEKPKRSHKAKVPKVDDRLKRTLRITKEMNAALMKLCDNECTTANKKIVALIEDYIRGQK